MEDYKGLPNFEDYTRDGKLSNKDATYVQAAIDLFRSLEYDHQIYADEIADHIELPKTKGYPAKITAIIMYITLFTDMWILSGSNGYRKVISNPEVEKIFIQYIGRINKAVYRLRRMAIKHDVEPNLFNYVADPFSKDDESDIDIDQELPLA
jgi:hypothetical protein